MSNAREEKVATELLLDQIRLAVKAGRCAAMALRCAATTCAHSPVPVGLEYWDTLRSAYKSVTLSTNMAEGLLHRIGPRSRVDIS